MNKAQHETMILLHKAELAMMRENQEKAFQLYDEARKQGSKKAQFICGTRLMVGHGCQKDFDKGMTLATASLTKSKIEQMVSALTEHYRQINDGNSLMKALEQYVFLDKSDSALYRVIKGYSTGKLLTMEVEQDMEKAVWFFVYRQYGKKWLGLVNEYMVNLLVRIKHIRAHAADMIKKNNQLVPDYRAHKVVDELIQERLVERIESLKQKLKKLGISQQELINI